MSTITVEVDLTIHTAEVVLRACHPFTARYSVTLRHTGTNAMAVDFAARGGETLPPDLAGDFSNALIEQHLRSLVAAETAPIRELLVAQAFCETDLLDRRDSESGEDDDPRRIVR